MVKTPVLIVGAGPTGLVLALSLAKQKIPVRIIDQNSGPGQASRAMVVHARTLELYRQWGFADEIVAQGVPIETARFFAHGREVAELSFEDIGRGMSPYPFALAYAQDDHEKFLVRKLREEGVQVEWETKLLGFAHDARMVRARVRPARRATEEVECAYLCGCDGAHSTVREGLQLGFPGGTYSQLFYVADVKVDGPFDTRLTITLGTDEFGVMLPVRTTGMQRWIGLVPPNLLGKKNLQFDDLRVRAERLFKSRVVKVNWFSTYHTHHRVAERFRVGRCFLLGDAGHIHSPAGGQGMNTGIGDAVNLGWKLGEVLQKRADAKILDSFEIERMAFAKSLVATTDKAFRLIVGRDFISDFFRSFVIPKVIGAVWNIEVSRRLLFRMLSQIHIHYPDSPLSRGSAAGLRAGDRLPWVKMANTDNFAALQSADWQIHVYGELSEEFAHACERREIAVHVFPWTQAARRAGFRRNAAYLIRPDSYLALILPKPEPDPLLRYLDDFKLKPKEDHDGKPEANIDSGERQKPAPSRRDSDRVRGL